MSSSSSHVTDDPDGGVEEEVQSGGLPISLAIIQSEYKNLPSVVADSLEVQAASAPLNISKNRYCNVLPLDSTRVRLTELDGQPNSDYINASIIKSECGGQALGHYNYIASQAPPFDTMGDFWRMVWEQNSSVLVMLTKLLERCRRKADAYWPEEEGTSLNYGDFQVYLKKQCVTSTMAIRALLLRPLSARDDEPGREIYHLHYLAWPDHGTPRSCASILELLIIMRDFVSRARVNQSLFGPVVVQCSAGIGRTGTLIAIHQSLELISAQGSCDVPKTVELLRRQRCGAVQTEEQYVFIYRTIHHALAFCSSLVQPER